MLICYCLHEVGTMNYQLRGKKRAENHLYCGDRELDKMHTNRFGLQMSGFMIRMTIASYVESKRLHYDSINLGAVFSEMQPLGLTF